MQRFLYVLAVACAVVVVAALGLPAWGDSPDLLWGPDQGEIIGTQTAAGSPFAIPLAEGVRLYRVEVAP